MEGSFELAQFSDYMREYNKLTEKCFARCINNMNSRLLGDDEKMMLAYQKMQPEILEKRQIEAEKNIKEIMEKQKILDAQNAAAEQTIQSSTTVQNS